MSQELRVISPSDAQIKQRENVAFYTDRLLTDFVHSFNNDIVKHSPEGSNRGTLHYAVKMSALKRYEVSYHYDKDCLRKQFEQALAAAGGA